jgi:DHA2 family multidrug resistance protein
LDRGEQNDWFNSSETWAEAVLMVVAFTYFAAHTALSRPDRSFFDFQLLKNRNYATGLLFIFVMGIVLYATRALMPTMLENLLDYPVATTGLVTAPTGIGTMIAMLFVGRLVGKVDVRLLLVVGFVATAVSLWQMSRYSLDLSTGDIIWPGVLQGMGLGFVFVPLSAATFATLAPAMRAQGTAIFSLIRNIGSSIGISLVQTMLIRNTQISHASLIEHITTASPAWNNAAVASVYDVSRPGGVAALDAAVTQQAAMIGYIDDFWMMFLLTLAVMPLILLIVPPRRSAAVDAHALLD